MMKIAIKVNSEPHDWVASLISIFTRSRAFHVEPVFSDGVSFVVTPKFIGLRSRMHDYDKYHWVLLDCPWMTEEEENKQRSWAESIVLSNAKYDYLGAISGCFGSDREDPSKWYCGEVCAKIFGDTVPEFKKLKWATPDKVWRLITEKIK